MICGACGKHVRIMVLGGMHRCTPTISQGGTLDDGSGGLWLCVWVLPTGRPVVRFLKPSWRPPQPMVPPEDIRL